jgi:hypothetical protein
MILKQMRVKDVESVINIVSHVGEWSNILRQFLSSGSLPRRETGFLIRSLKSGWKASWLLDCGIDLVPSMDGVSVEQLAICSTSFPFGIFSLSTHVVDVVSVLNS